MSPLSTQPTTDYLALIQTLAAEFAPTAAERDLQGGTPLVERDRLRHSGLLNLIIPAAYGGAGDTWITAMQVSRELSQVDSSLAHVLSYHYLGVVIPHIFGSPEQAAHYYRETVERNWFWCNALNPLDRRTTLTPSGNAFRLNGIKSFCSGSKDSDILPITATDSQTGETLVLAIPTRREGIQIHSDWDNMGQRQTDSGSVTFHDVPVFAEEIIGQRSQNSHSFRTIRSCLTQLNLANIYLGIALGAFEAAKQYTRTESRPWYQAGVEQVGEDPLILRHYGELWVDLQATIALTDRAGELLQAAWEQEWYLSAEQRGSCAVAIATAKVAATRTGLAVTNRIFDVMGARATARRYNFDRYWRNLRTFTLHDPVDYKIQDLGNWALNDEFPQPGFYS